jgi:hypothetical protein
MITLKTIKYNKMNSTKEIMENILSQEQRMIQHLKDTLYNQTDRRGVSNWKARLIIYNLENKNKNSEFLDTSDYSLVDIVLKEINSYL